MRALRIAQGSTWPPKRSTHLVRPRAGSRPTRGASARFSATSTKSPKCRTSSRFSARATSSSSAPTRRPAMSRASRRRFARCSRSWTSPAPRTSTSTITSSKHPKYDTDECRQRGLTYAAPMRVTLRLTTFEIDPETEAKSVIDIKEQDVYMGDMPLMTHERHLHHQRHRARHRQPDAPLAGRAVRPRPRQDPRQRQVSSSPRASSPIAAAGSTSSSTPRTSSTSASTASASCRSPRCSMRSA